MWHTSQRQKIYETGCSLIELCLLDLTRLDISEDIWKRWSPAYSVHKGDVRRVVEFNRIFLSGIRRKALRKGVWFKVLDCAERAILSLTPRCMEKPRSSKLIEMLAKIIVKIESALKSPVDILVGQIGKPLAKRLSQTAQKWGHKNAGAWATDDGFCRYLTIVEMNY